MITSGSSAPSPASCLGPPGSPNIFQPIAVTSIPPATRTTGRVIPKNSRITEPNTIEPSSSQKLLSATPSASWLRCCGVHAEVKLKKIGADPSGLTTGKRPANTNKKALDSSIIDQFRRGHHVRLWCPETRRDIGGEARQRRLGGWAARTGFFMVRDARAALLTTRDAKTSLLVAIDLLALLVTLLRLHRQRGDRAGFEPLQRDRLAGLLAIAIGVVVDALQRRVDLGDQLALPVARAQFDGAIGFGRSAVGEIRMVDVLFLERLQGDARFP